MSGKARKSLTSDRFRGGTLPKGSFLGASACKQASFLRHSPLGYVPIWIKIGVDNHTNNISTNKKAKKKIKTYP